MLRSSLGLLFVVACVHAPPATAAPPALDDPDGSETEPAGDGDEGDDAPLELSTGPAGGGSPALLAEARRELAAMRASAYTHHTHVDEARGTFDYDCSGFLDYALRRADPAAFAELVHATVRRPLAKHVVAFLEAGGGPTWHRIARARDLVAGDVIAWRKPADVVTRNTGHVLIVRGKPIADPAYPGALIVPIIDSTAVTHGTSDSRRADHATGLGQGEVILVLDSTGAPIGYRWSRGRKAHVHPTRVALGRIAPIRSAR
jgi:hypothetical protein